MNDDKFKALVADVMDTLSIKPNDRPILYLDQITKIIECYDAPYCMAVFPDGSRLMIPKGLITIEQLQKLCLKLDRA